MALIGFQGERYTVSRFNGEGRIVSNCIQYKYQSDTIDILAYSQGSMAFEMVRLTNGVSNFDFADQILTTGQ